jgi:hypothetical protein
LQDQWRKRPGRGEFEPGLAGNLHNLAVTPPGREPADREPHIRGPAVRRRHRERLRQSHGCDLQRRAGRHASSVRSSRSGPRRSGRPDDRAPSAYEQKHGLIVSFSPEPDVERPLAEPFAAGEAQTATDAVNRRRQAAGADRMREVAPT